MGDESPTGRSEQAGPQRAESPPDIADWRLAESVAWRLATVSVPATDAAEVAGLRADIAGIARVADSYARRATTLGDGLGPPTVRVVGRREWIRSNMASLAWITAPLREKVAERTGGRALSRRLVGAQVGTVFGFLATRVLGQYEVLLPGGEIPGRLTLVGPNLLHVERTVLPEVGVAASEFRLGVVLHELAHRLQFEAVPWMRAELHDILDAYIDDTQLGTDRIREIVDGVVDMIREPERLTDLRELMQLVLTPRQRGLLDRAQNLMTLLEGHGNVTMDWGAELMGADGDRRLDPSRVRRALNARREHGNATVRRAMGLAMKAEQYKVGEEFILDVAERHGREVFARVWETPEHLPDADELRDPDAWAQRVSRAD